MTASESNVQANVRLEAARIPGVMLWRNNVGVLRDQNDRPVRYGLANDSPQLNRQLKSGDLIGWRSVVITPDMVGRTVAVFVSRECKYEGWRFNPNDEREAAQARWRDLILAAGGDAAFTAGPGSL